MDDEKEKPDEIRIRLVPKDLKVTLDNVCKNLHVNKSAFLKTKIREILNTYPKEMRDQDLTAG